MKRKPTTSADWPEFDSPLLRDIAEAFRLRRKALRYRAGLSCEREFTETTDGASERLNIDLRDDRIRLSVWEDGVLWFRVCVSATGRNSGWAFMDSFHDDVQDVSARTLVGMVEATLAIGFGADPPTEREQLRNVWDRVRPRSG